MRTFRTGSAGFLAEQAGVASLMALRAYLGLPSDTVGASLHRTTVRGRQAFFLTSDALPGTHITFTVLRTIAPAEASARKLFEVRGGAARLTQREVAPGTPPPHIEAFWFGPSLDGMTLRREYVETDHASGGETAYFQYEDANDSTRTVDLEERAKVADEGTGTLVLPTEGGSTIRLRDGTRAVIESVDHPSATPAPIPLAHTVVWLTANATWITLRTTTDAQASQLVSRLGLVSPHS